MKVCKIPHCEARHRARGFCMRHYHIRDRYDVHPLQYEMALYRQGWKCLVCEAPFARPGELEHLGKQERLKRPCVDHCHKTGAFRGLLCLNCNIALGQVKDNPELLQRLIDYLMK